MPTCDAALLPPSLAVQSEGAEVCSHPRSAGPSTPGAMQILSLILFRFVLSMWHGAYTLGCPRQKCNYECSGSGRQTKVQSVSCQRCAHVSVHAGAEGTPASPRKTGYLISPGGQARDVPDWEEKGYSAFAA